MISFLRYLILVISCLLFQIVLLPAFLEDPFQPNLLVIVIAYLGLRSRLPITGFAVFLIGLLQDCFSGIYLGLHAFSYSCMYLVLQHVAGQLYTDRRSLMILVVFCGTIASGLLNLLLLMLFSAADGIYSTLLPALLPQGLVNALIASVVFSVPSLAAREDAV
jgi:rod shape-determining protein MreD